MCRRCRRLRQGTMMAHAGLAEPSLWLLRAAVAEGGTVARFRAKIAVVPGSGCEYWTSAISGRGHGRFRVGEVPAVTWW